MSSCLIVYNNKMMTLSGDSATCYNYKNDVYRLNTNAEKIKRFENKVLFLSGVQMVTSKIEQEFEVSDRSVQSLQNIVKKNHLLHENLYNGSREYYNVSAVLVEWTKGRPTAYIISSVNEFEIEENFSEDDEFYMIAEGSRNDVVIKSATKYFRQMQKGVFSGIPNLYKKVYDEVAYEGIGGKLTVYAIQNRQLFIALVHNIKEPKNLKRITDIAWDFGNGTYKFFDSIAHNIKDDLGRLRAQMGKLDGGKYGLMLKDSQGDKTVIDENGILQTYSFMAQDNLDSVNSLVIPFFVDEGTHEVRECKVNIMLDNFRAYSKAASSGGGATSSSGGSHRHVMYSKYNGGGLYNYNQGLYQFPSVGDGTAVLGLSLQIADFNGVLPNGAFPTNIYTLESAGNHSHTVPNHVHGLDFGIYKGSKANNCGVNINSHNVASGINSNTQIDISPYVSLGWNTLEITSSSLGRVVAGIFLKLFVTT